MRDQRVRGDADEPGREAALRHEGGVGAGGELADRAGDGDVLGEVEIVCAGRTRCLCDTDIAVVREARDHRLDRVRAQVCRQRLPVAGVEAMGVQVVEPVRLDDRARDARVDVCDVDVVVARLREQAGDQGTDLACPENEDLVHFETPGWSAAWPGDQPRSRPAARLWCAILTKWPRRVTCRPGVAFYCNAAIRVRIAG